MSLFSCGFFNSTVILDWCTYRVELGGHLQRRLVVQVELQRAVVQLDVGHLGDDVLEVALLPRVRRVVHHGDDRVVELLVLVVQEHELRPQMRLLGSAQDLGDVDMRPEELKVLSHLLWLELGVEDRQLGEHFHVSTLESKSSLKQLDQFFQAAAVL